MSKVIAVGATINIMRSNGNFQRVQVVQINNDDNVTVEWIENGDSKGKEVTLSQIYDWNPTLRHGNKDVSSKIKVIPRRTVFAKQNLINIPPVEPTGYNNRKKSIAGGVLKGMKENIFPPKCLAAVKRRQSNVDFKDLKIKKSLNEMSKNSSASAINDEFLEMIQNFQDGISPRAITIRDKIKNDTRIVVCVRKRPLNEREKMRSDIDILSIPDPNTTLVHECKFKVDTTKYLENHKFQFDYVFDVNADNKLVYNFTAEPLVDCLFSGGMATIFAYGQTGSGKTFTMTGDPSSPNTLGIYQYTVQDVFQRLRLSKNKGLTAKISLFEIYAGRIYDLLNGRSVLRMLEDTHGQVQICGLTEFDVSTPEQAFKVIQEGSTKRTSGRTSANPHSSRSHLIFQLSLCKKLNNRKNQLALFGKFSLIDLAGNERGVDTDNCDRQTRLEGAEINKSLLALKECIRALCRKGAHLPFRASKLTQVLRDSFISENSRTCMIATVSPGLSCCENTLNTLRYTDRVKEIEIEKRQEIAFNAKTSQDSLDTICGDNADLYKFRQTVDNIFASEEDLYNQHKQIVSEYPEWLNYEEKLINSIETGDQDIENYVNILEKVVNERFVAFNKLKDKLNTVKSKLNDEELARKSIKQLPTF